VNSSSSRPPSRPSIEATSDAQVILLPLAAENRWISSRPSDWLADVNTDHAAGRLRTATQRDLARLQVIQVASGTAFRDLGMDDIADNAPLSLDVLARYQQAERAWLATDERGAPVAFIVVDLIDGNAHIEQVSVHPDHARQGIGRMLIEHVASWADERKLQALTLTTFRSVPFNAPYYRRLGFHELAPEQITPGLGEVLAAEVAFGLDPSSRVCMRRQLT
jgi:GNAT superfamily N-acetyltransferase